MYGLFGVTRRNSSYQIIIIDLNLFNNLLKDCDTKVELVENFLLSYTQKKTFRSLIKLAFLGFPRYKFLHSLHYKLNYLEFFALSHKSSADSRSLTVKVSLESSIKILGKSALLMTNCSSFLAGRALKRKRLRKSSTNVHHLMLDTFEFAAD